MEAYAALEPCYDVPLDPGVADIMAWFKDLDVYTFQSCEGGDGHTRRESTVWFEGGQAEGLRVMAAALREGLPVASLRRVWDAIDGEVVGPWWEMTFYRQWTRNGSVPERTLGPSRQWGRGLTKT
jgi:hypothetical protein